MALIDELNPQEQALLEANQKAFKADLTRRITAGKGKVCCQHPSCSTPDKMLLPSELLIIVTPQLLIFAVDQTCAQIESLNSKFKTVKVKN
jgi:hypothetical protein